MFCKKCGAALEQEARFCRGCGSATLSGSPPGRMALAPAKAKTRSRAWMYLLIAVAVLFFIRVVVPTTTPATVVSQTPTQPSTQTSDVRHKVGEDVIVGYWAYRCTRARWSNWKDIGAGYKQRADAKFLLVDLAIRNNDKTASALPPMTLVDDSGREYNSDGNVLKDLNPGVSSGVSVVFDVPPGKYSLKVSGGFTSGQSTLIDMPIS